MNGRAGSIRIIAGAWRGRKLPVADRPGLRPTPDRLRETLFNWLRAEIPGARCLDLFAGSGALGFEAASRGARSVLMIERDAALAEVLRGNQSRLGADSVSVIHADAIAWLDVWDGVADVVFLDPPFKSGLLEPACAILVRRELVAVGGRVYIETDAAATLPALPRYWCPLRETRVGQVAGRLFLNPGVPVANPESP